MRLSNLRKKRKYANNSFTRTRSCSSSQVCFHEMGQKCARIHDGTVTLASLEVDVSDFSPASPPSDRLCAKKMEPNSHFWITWKPKEWLQKMDVWLNNHFLPQKESIPSLFGGWNPQSYSIGRCLGFLGYVKIWFIIQSKHNLQMDSSGFRQEFFSFSPRKKKGVFENFRRWKWRFGNCVLGDEEENLRCLKFWPQIAGSIIDYI